MLNDGDDLITELEGHFIDASLYRDRMPNTFITVPDIVLESCRRITSPEKQFANLDPITTLPSVLRLQVSILSQETITW